MKPKNFRLRRLGTMIIGRDDILARRRRRTFGSIESGKTHSFVIESTTGVSDFIRDLNGGFVCGKLIVVLDPKNELYVQ